MLNAIEVTTAVFTRGLQGLKMLSTKGDAYATESGMDPKLLLDAQLADDMYTFAIQAHWACEASILSVGRLLGTASPPRADAPKSFAELNERVDATIAALSKVDPEALEAGLTRTIEIPYPRGVLTYRGDQFVTQFAIPNFFFHLTTAYGILRAKGVPLRKSDFLGA